MCGRSLWVAPLGRRSLGGTPIWGRSAAAARHPAVALCSVFVFPHKPIQLQRVHLPDATLDVAVVAAVVRLNAFLSRRTNIATSTALSASRC